MGLLQNAVFRPEQKIYALKELVRTAVWTVLTNFFFDLIFQNLILQQRHYEALLRYEEPFAAECYGLMSRMLLIIRAARTSEGRIEGLVFQRFARKATLRVKNTTEDSVEFIFEMTRKTLDRGSKDKSITDALYEAGGVEHVNIVAQNDEISS